MDRNLLNKVIEAIKCNEKNEELELLSKLVQIPIIGAENGSLKTIQNLQPQITIY